MARPDPIEFARLKLVERVRAAFNDASKGETPIPPSDEAFFAPDTPIRMVHADLVSMMVGGMSALLLQMLHPHALQGVLDFSNFREDMHGRLRRTARFIAVTTYGHRDDAEAAIERVNRIHSRVSGALPDGSVYHATNPRTLAWVHVTEALMFLEAWLVHVRPEMPVAEQDEYFRQFALIARKLGADPVPETKAEAQAMFRSLRADLRATPEAREVAKLVLEHRPPGPAGTIQPFMANAAISLLPPFARTMLDLDAPGLASLPSKLVTGALGSTMRWAFQQKPRG
ncbi:oxygenase MpaB family protein [Aurantiacibacter sp. D1-12]|uniref:oxygenase MpaB family protein n=1 Tax=Aurantiacibacter sp. D1-12 TaxID=2993658 RepID=UPI00237C7175|nr:oxygenase MpaB family protein [Aurantiacibacter sp. D1-12]MDE1466275.1 oxygenase MpaB family protein [Aurantiacibacter sp. D1-12]